MHVVRRVWQSKLYYLYNNHTKIVTYNSKQMSVPYTFMNTPHYLILLFIHVKFKLQTLVFNNKQLLYRKTVLSCQSLNCKHFPVISRLRSRRYYYKYVQNEPTEKCIHHMYGQNECQDPQKVGIMPQAPQGQHGLAFYRGKRSGVKAPQNLSICLLAGVFFVKMLTF